MLYIYVGHPVLLMSSEDTVVEIGHTAKLFCSFLVRPNDGRIFWQKSNGNSLVVIDPSEKYHLYTNGTLTIKATTDNDNGTYHCTASNSRGNTTAVVNLLVIGT